MTVLRHSRDAFHPLPLIPPQADPPVAERGGQGWGLSSSLSATGGQASIPAFTTVELLISMAMMVVAMVGVVGIFNISSTTAAKTAAHAEVLEASAALQAELNDQLAHITSGLLIIESPAPTTVRAEIPRGPQLLRLRHDRLIFIATQNQGTFQSFTDPQRGTPFTRAVEPATSLQALIYFGPGIPVGSDGVTRPIVSSVTEQADTTLAASEWRFTERATLLLQQLDGGWIPLSTPNTATTPPDITAFTAPGGMLDGGPLVDVLLKSKVDAVWPWAGVSRSLSSLIIDTIGTRNITGRDNDPTPSQIHALWQPSWAPSTARIDLPNPAPYPPDQYPPDYYMRTGATFLPRLADFRIEWTDGRRIDPNGPDGFPPGDPSDTNDGNMGTRWFGLAPDPAYQPDPNDAMSMNNMTYQARMRGVASRTPLNPSNPNANNPDNPAAETEAFLHSPPDSSRDIEWSPNGVAPAVDAAYRAVWRSDNWQYRPKALRFTYRLYDAGNRLQQKTTTDLNENGLADPDTNTSKAVVTRFGQEFSIVVPVP